jgi:uncharacterized membrane protein
VAELIAIGYDDMEMADRAAEEVYRLAHDLVIEPEHVAVIVRDEDGRYHVHTNHHPVAEGLTWGMLWGALFGLLLFVPLFGLAVGGVFGALFGVFERIGVDKTFQQEVRDMLKPGTSALFLVVDKVTPDKAIDALSKFGGHVLKTSLTKDAEAQLQAALQGSSAPEPAAVGTAAS